MRSLRSLPLAAFAAAALVSGVAEADDAGATLQIAIPARPAVDLATASPTTLANLPKELLDTRTIAYRTLMARAVTPVEVEAALPQPAMATTQPLPNCISAALKLSSKSGVNCSPEPTSALTR